MTRLHLGDCLDMMRDLEACSVDAVVCDPPYGLGKPPPIERVLSAWLAGERVEVVGGGFMNAKWDAFVPGVRYWREVARVLKPGGHAVVFAGQRTIDVMGIALRLAGMQPRDLIGWQYWSGFPKSLAVGAAIDRAAGAERDVVGIRRTAKGQATAGHDFGRGMSPIVDITAPARWEGWGTALKPSIEPALLVRKPLDGTVAGNVQRWGTGAIHVDGCRYAYGDPAWPGPSERPPDGRSGASPPSTIGISVTSQLAWVVPSAGRFPANVYACPKASTAERERGCDGLPMWSAGELVDRVEGSAGMSNPRAGAGRTSSGRRNKHPTVKPVTLLRWLCRLVTPPAGVVLDPFMGSGSCGVAAVLEGFDYIGAELDPDFHRIAAARIQHATDYPEAWGDTVYGGKSSDERQALEASGQVSLWGQP